MKISKWVAALATVSVLGLGAFAGSVIGSDGGVDVASRLTGDFGKPDPAKLHIEAGAMARAKSGGGPAVVYGFTSKRPIAAGDSDLTSITCPKKFPVPLSVGLESSGPGVFPGILAHSSSDNGKRVMLAAAVNTTQSAAKWQVTATCSKGIALG